MREEIAEAGVELLRARSTSTSTPKRPRRDHRPVRRDRDPLGDEADRRPDRGGPTNLKVIGRAGVGVDNVDVEAATRRGIVVANAPESNIVSAAEHTVGLLVALARNIPQAHAALVEGRWERSKWGGVELAEKTLGMLGFGRIGQQVARRALGLQMRVVAYDPFVSAERFRELGVESDTLRRCARAGRLPHAAPAAERRDARRDRRRRDREDEGRRAHRQRRPRRAGRRGRARSPRSSRARSPAPRSTSSPQEPYSGPLLDAPNIVVTPHLAASTDEAQDRAGVIVAEQVVAALEGGLVTNAVNIPSVGAEDLEVLGPFVPLAASLGRLALELARGEPRQIALEYYGELAEYDTRLLTRRGAERRLPRPRRPARQLRQRAADRRRARDRGRRGAAARLARLHEPRRGRARATSASRARRSAARTASGSSPRSGSRSRSSWRRA